MGGTVLDTLTRDVRLAARRMVRQGFFSAVAVGCLALGMGATTVVVSLLGPMLRAGNAGAPWALVAASGAVFLLATANVASLLLVRSQRGSWERALRSALGARCRRLAQQGLAENLLLAGAGAVSATGLAWGGLRLAEALAVGPARAELAAVGLSLPALGLAAGMAVVVAGTLSVVSAVRGPGDLDLLRVAQGCGCFDRRRRRIQASLGTLQVALALLLLVAAGLTTRSALAQRANDPGVDVAGLRVLEVASAEPAAVPRILSALRALPSVVAVGAVAGAPLEAAEASTRWRTPSAPSEAATAATAAAVRWIAPGTFEALGVPLLSGRDATDAGGAPASGVALVSRSFAARAWPGGDARGRRIQGWHDASGRWLEVVGVVDDVGVGGSPDGARPAVWLPLADAPPAVAASVTVAVRLAPGADDEGCGVPAVARSAAPGASVSGLVRGSDLVRAARGPWTLAAGTVSAFALVGLVLAVSGMYGVTAHGVGRRRQEIGVRVALGASPGQVRRLVLGYAARIAVGGLTAGLIVTGALTPVFALALPGVGGRDVLLGALVGVPLAAAVVLAAWLPARRATAVDPTAVLRSG